MHAEARALGVDVRDLEGPVVAGHHRERQRVGGPERDERAEDPPAARVGHAASQRPARELEPELERLGLRRAERDRGLGEVPAGPIDHGTDPLDSVGRRVFEHVLRVASGEVPARAEETKHREFQFWAEQSVSL